MCLYVHVCAHVMTESYSDVGLGNKIPPTQRFIEWIITEDCIAVPMHSGTQFCEDCITVPWLWQAQELASVVALIPPQSHFVFTALIPPIDSSLVVVGMSGSTESESRVWERLSSLQGAFQWNVHS